MTLDPLAAAVAPFTAASAASNVVLNTLSISKEFSSVTKAHEFTIEEIHDLETPAELQVSRDGEPATITLALDLARRFETGLDYTRHCRVAGIRCVRHAMALTLSGSIAPYCVEGRERRIATDPDGNQLFGFHDLFLRLGIRAGGGQNPFNKFNEDATIAFTPEFHPNDGYLKINWRLTSLGFAIGGFPVALTKFNNGAFRLGAGATLTPEGENTWKFFQVRPIQLPSPFDEVAPIDDQGPEPERPITEAPRIRRTATRPLSTEASGDLGEPAQAPGGPGEPDQAPGSGSRWMRRLRGK